MIKLHLAFPYNWTPLNLSYAYLGAQHLKYAWFDFFNLQKATPWISDKNGWYTNYAYHKYKKVDKKEREYAFLLQQSNIRVVPSAGKEIKLRNFMETL
jgi:hypothetical protein